MLTSSIRLLEETVGHQRRCIANLLDQIILLEAGQSHWIALIKISPGAPSPFLILQSIHTTGGATRLSSNPLPPGCITNKKPEVLAITVPIVSLPQGLGSSPGPEYVDIPGILDHVNKLVSCPLPPQPRPNKQTVSKHRSTQTASCPCLPAPETAAIDPSKLGNSPQEDDDNGGSQPFPLKTG